MFQKFGIPFETKMVGLYSGTMAEDLEHLAPARLVPVMETSEGVAVGDTLAMAETLHERHPDAGLFPEDPTARALCRWLVAEMHSGFTAMRGDCPMILAHGYAGFVPSKDVLADIARIETLWTFAREKYGSESPWLFGRYSLADVFYAPVATRIATYGLPVCSASQAYVDAHLADLDFRQWRAMGLTKAYDPMPYGRTEEVIPWPGPTSQTGTVVDAGPSVNKFCPYSGGAVTHFMQLSGHVWGFCNAFCRDKTAADHGAWPQFQKIYQPVLNETA